MRAGLLRPRVLFCREAHEPLLEDVDAQRVEGGDLVRARVRVRVRVRVSVRARVRAAGGDRDVDADVELVAVDEKRARDVPTDHDVVARQLVRVGDDGDAAACRGRGAWSGVRVRARVSEP
jgi:hypothetical protein